MHLEMLSVPPCNLTVSKFDKINLLVALIALAVALASLAYSFWMNRRKIDITDCEIHTCSVDPPLVLFEIQSYSHVPITITKLEFFDGDERIIPLRDYEPTITFSKLSFGSTPNIIPQYKFAAPLTGKQVLHPHMSLEFSYYFRHTFSDLIIRVTCKERIHGLKRRKKIPVSSVTVDDD